jgi:hypothetical protein
VSSGWAIRQVDQMSDTEAFAYFAQLHAGGRKETAQQPIAAERSSKELSCGNRTYYCAHQQ